MGFFDTLMEKIDPLRQASTYPGDQGSGGGILDALRERAMEVARQRAEEERKRREEEERRRQEALAEAARQQQEAQREAAQQAQADARSSFNTIRQASNNPWAQQREDTPSFARTVTDAIQRTVDPEFRQREEDEARTAAVARYAAQFDTQGGILRNRQGAAELGQALAAERAREYEEVYMAADQYIKSTPGLMAGDEQYQPGRDNPIDYLARNKAVREWVNPMDPKQTAQSFLSELKMPTPVIGALFEHYSTQDGQKDFRGAGVVPGAVPVDAMLPKTGIKPADFLISGLTEAAGAPVLDALAGGATSGNELLSDIAMMEAKFLPLAAGGLEAEAGRALAGRAGTNAAARLGANVLGRSAVSAGETAPLVAAAMGLRGENPLEADNLKALGLQAGIDAVGGGAPTLVGTAGKSALSAVPRPLGRAWEAVGPELAIGAGSYGAARAAGWEDEDARLAAIAAGLGTSVARRGFGDTVKDAAGLRPALGNPPLGLSIENAKIISQSDAPTGVWKNSLARTGEPGIHIEPMTRDASLTDLDRQLPGTTAAVARDAEGKVAGYLAISDGRPGFEPEVWVDPKYRRTGVGTQLVEAARQAGHNVENDINALTPEGKALFDSLPPAPPAEPPATAPPPKKPQGPPPPMPPDDEIARIFDDNLRTIRYAAESTNVNRGVANMGLGGVKPLAVLDPAVRLEGDAGKQVLTATAAGANGSRLAEARIYPMMKQAMDALNTFAGDRGPKGLQTAGRALAEVAPPAAALTYAQLHGDPGIDDPGEKAALLAAGLGTGLLSNRYSKGYFRAQNFDVIKAAEVAPTAVRNLKGYDKLVDIIEQPQNWQLTPTQKASLDTFQAVRERAVADVNATRKQAGLSPITKNEANSLYHLWDSKTIKKYLPDRPKTSVYVDSGIGQKQGSALQRTLVNPTTGKPVETLAEAREFYPDAKLAGGGDPRKILQAQFSELAKMRGDAITKIALDQNPDHAVRPPSGKKGKEQVKELEKKGWSKVAGLGDTYYSPDMLKHIKSFFVDPRANPAMNTWLVRMLDRANTEVRQALYSADFSPWTMQGLMAAIAAPRKFADVTNILPLAGTSLFGEKFLNWWLDRQPGRRSLWDEFHRAGAVSGYEEPAIQKQIKTFADLPGIEHLDKNGFLAFLPMARFLVWQNEREAGRWLDTIDKGLQKTGPASIPSRYLGGRVAGALPALNDMAVPAVAATGAYALTDQADLETYQKVILAALATPFFVHGINRVEGTLGRQLLTKLDEGAQTRIDVRAAKMANREAGTLNRATLGMTPQQTVTERIIFRSPTLVRNALSLANKALTDPGVEGAQSFYYLVKTAALITAGAYGLAKLTGQPVSLDPEDENFVLRRDKIGKVDAGPLGKFGVSNPQLALMKAFLNVPDIEGADYGTLDHWSPESMGAGLLGWVQGRTSDTIGSGVINPALGGLAKYAGVTPKTYGDEDLTTGPSDILPDAGSKLTPLGIQEVTKSGAFSGIIPEAGQNIGLDIKDPFPRDPDYNSNFERKIGPLAALGGMNYSPETLTQEYNRRTEDAIREWKPSTKDTNLNGRIDLSDLNSADKRAFRATPAGRELDDFQKNEQQPNLPARDETSPVSRYISEKDRLLDEHVKKMKALDLAAQTGRLEDGTPFSKFAYKKALQDEFDRYRAAKDTIDESIGQEMIGRMVLDPATNKGTDMTVSEYLGRNDHPEDKAVNDYYELAEKFRRSDGSLNFDAYEAAQEKYLAGLKPSIRSYVQGELDYFKNKGIADSEGKQVDLPTYREYQNVKTQAKPFWELKEQAFQQIKQLGGPLFSQFDSYGSMQRWIDEQSVGGLDVTGALINRSKEYQLFEKLSQMAERQMRGGNPALDYGLTDFYQRAPVNPLGYIATQYGDSSYDNLGPALAASKRRLSTAQQAAFASQFGTDPRFATAQFTRTFGLDR